MRMNELNEEINQTSAELESTKKELLKVFKELSKLKEYKEKGFEFDQEYYNNLVFNNKLLQMKRNKLITHLNYLNKEFYESFY